MNKDELEARIRLVLAKTKISEELTTLNTKTLLSGTGSRQVKFNYPRNNIIKEKINNTVLDNSSWDLIYKDLELLSEEHDIYNPNQYSIDMSSLFMAAPLFSLINNQNLNILDTCSAPGGKSILASSILDYCKLVSNEKSKERLRALKDNFSRLDIKNYEVTNFDIRDLNKIISRKFDLVLVDGPCSGQALLSKGFVNYSAYSSMKIKISAEIQKKILLASLKFMSNNSYLLYSTCTFSIEENENVIKWLIKKFPYLKPQLVPYMTKHLSKVEPEIPCYKLYPSEGLGSGGFTCLLKKE